MVESFSIRGVAPTPEQLGEVLQWAAESKDRGVVFSVPTIEVWLLLHYVEAKGVRSQKEVEAALKTHWPTLTKKLRTLCVKWL